MNQPIPIKRHEALQPLSHDHHHGLLLCWKIRTDFKNNIAITRIKNYCDWFYKAHILPHFELEEKVLFPILGLENELVKTALADHRRLSRHFENQKEIQKSLSFIEEELEAHIRFEERTLFNEIQKIAPEETLKKIHLSHTETKMDIDWEDNFWDVKQ